MQDPKEEVKSFHREYTIGRKQPGNYTGLLVLKVGRDLGNTPSRTVESFDDIKAAAADLCDYMDELNGWFPGGDGKEVFAISHCQVCNEPWNFFVVDSGLMATTRTVEKEDHQTGRKITDCEEITPMFISQVIINPEVIDGGQDTTIKEGCLSFRNGPKYVDRFMVCTVRYQVPDAGEKSGLREIKETIFGIKAQIFQHAVEHSRGENIYYDIDGNKK